MYGSHREWHVRLTQGEQANDGGKEVFLPWMRNIELLPVKK